jgi:arginine exporter protein ArgO
MKTFGVILLVLGILSTLGAIMAAANGHSTSFGGVAFLVLGGFLISRANLKKEEEIKKREWSEQNKKDNI